MLENIKSFLYFSKIVFSLINTKRKLKIVKYNKSLQNIIGIDLTYYIICSGKYIIYESNGKGKEYLREKNILIFEGEYINGKRNGKGKEYYPDGELKFEGEYLNGKRNGKGKEYDMDGHLLFDCEYLNGYRWSGKRFDFISDNFLEFNNGNFFIKENIDVDDELIFEGEYLNGKKNGKGKEYYFDDNLKFEGEYLNGEKNGKGKEYNKLYNLVFEGEYKYGKRWNGKIIDKKNGTFYELINGNGFVKENDDYCFIKYEVNYINGDINGKGKELTYDHNSLIYEGEYLNGKREGKGKEYNNAGDLIFEGEYFYGYKKKGKAYVNKILEYEGEYLFEKKWNGKGYDEKGNIVYELINGNGKVNEYDEYYSLIKFEGEYLNGEKNGKGKEYDDGDLLFEGEYLNGKRWNGKGKEYDEFNALIFEGEYINGEKKQDNLD